MPYLAKALSSNFLRAVRRYSWQTYRAITKSKPKLHVFIRINDPYSYLLILAIPNFAKRFNIDIDFHTILEMDNRMFPELDMWHQHAHQDAQHLAQLYNLPYPLQYNKNLSQEYLELATSLLLKAESNGNYLAKALEVFKLVWTESPLPTKTAAEIAESTLNARLESNHQLLRNKGHYFGAMTYFEGEWYWGIDRLDHLETRLITLGLSHSPEEKVYYNLTYNNFCEKPLANSSLVNRIEPLTLYWSARSPYSYLGLEQAVKLANFYKIPLNIKPVLPMVMRGMQVPKIKKMYIFLDTKREAEKLSIPYGFVADPLGAAVERCYALLEYAEKEEKLIEFLLSFARAVNAEGIRAETDSGLKKIVERCGLNWQYAKTQLASTSWQHKVNTNLEEMLALGCWGVPSFNYAGVSYWGQDRLGIIEQAIRKNLSEHK